MISKSQNAACLHIGRAASANPAWMDYANYCILREKGLRKEAFTSLSNFLSAARNWPFEDQKGFVLWLCDQMDKIRDGGYGPYPNPLMKQLVEPVFEKCLEEEGVSGELYALKAQYTCDFDAYFKAIALDPDNARARVALARASILAVQYSTHHLPAHFIGSVDEALESAEEAREHLFHLVDGKTRASLEKWLKEEVHLLDDWIEFKQSDGEDFGRWCEERGRTYRWNTIIYYEPKKSRKK